MAGTLLYALALASQAVYGGYQSVILYNLVIAYHK